jgi:hypothetical protein
VLRAALALGTFLLVSGCSKSLDGPPISRREYVDAYVDILSATDTTEDEVTASRVAQEILERRGISEDDLLEYTRFYDDDPEYLANVWMEIEMRLRNPEPDSASMADSAAVIN